MKSVIFRRLTGLAAGILFFSMFNPPSANAENVIFPCSVSGTYIVDMPSGVLTSQNSCKGVVNIDASVKSIKEFAFFRNYDITAVVIPSSVSEISNWAFDGAWNLSSVTLSPGLTKIGLLAFNGTKISSINLPNTLVAIGREAFWGTKLVNVAIPNSVQTIDSGAFGSIPTLTSVSFGTGLRSIGDRAFYGSSLSVVDIPDSVSIGSSAFDGIKSLTKIIYCGKNGNFSTTPTCPPERKAIFDKAAADKAAADAAAKAAADKAAADKAAADKAAAEKRASDELARINSLKFSITCNSGSGKKKITRVVMGDPPSCPKGFTDVSAKFLPHKAYLGCKLYKRDNKYFGSVSLLDGGRTLTFSTFGKYSYLGPSIPKESDFVCATQIMQMPSYVLNQINTTRALDGRVNATWGKMSATWTYHPDNGLNISFYNN